MSATLLRMSDILAKKAGGLEEVSVFIENYAAGQPKPVSNAVWYGALAQLGERFAGSEEVRSSILLGSTKNTLSRNVRHSSMNP